MYNLQSKTVNCYSQNSLRDTPHLKVFCLNNHVYLIVFVISYVHLGFMLYLLLFNESLLHYLSIMCVTMMVFCVCMNDSVHLLYISIYFCLWWSYLWWALILHVAFSFTTCIIMLVVSMLKTEFNSSVLLNLVVYIQISLFVNYSFTVLFCKCVKSFSVVFTKLFWQPQLPKLFCKNYWFFFYSIPFKCLGSVRV